MCASLPASTARANSARVVDGGGSTVYAMRTDDRTLTGGSLGNTDLTSRASEPYGAAYNMLDNAYRAFETLLPHVTGTAPDLTFEWQLSQPHACTSCYGSDRIYMGGGDADPDEWDDDVILHEFGHYFVHRFSDDDNPAGFHGVERDPPKLAYGEGIATAIEALVQNDAYHTDSTPEYTGAYDFENLANASDYMLGTSDGTLTR